MMPKVLCGVCVYDDLHRPFLWISESTQMCLVILLQAYLCLSHQAQLLALEQSDRTHLKMNNP